ncbi:hypothetical protein F4780DRAFT_432129 [Xylariomycetidae sp. FL0641]|nr:hypothetical protein F4780DRAFT_432129 [Xylariomycetidae sp. FL0641]
MNHETVGSLLAVIANSINDALRILNYADKRAWGPDEFEQLRLLDDTIDEAKKDFQELPALVNGRFYYENDVKDESLEDLRILCTRFELHSQTFKDWARTGGPINPTWASETIELKRELHRAQCRAARRIYNETEQVDTRSRCLGAKLVAAAQRRHQNPNNHAQNRDHGQGRHFIPPDSQGEQASFFGRQQDHTAQARLEELAATNSTGKFERFADKDIAFVCDFCDGYLVWEDLREMPSVRATMTPSGEMRDETDPQPVTRTATTSTTTTTATATATTTPPLENWQATGFSMNGEEKLIVFAPIAIANHLPPEPGNFESAILCPYCDEYYYEEQGDDDMDRVRYTQDEHGIPDVKTFQEHLDWYHTSYTNMVPKTSNCSVM